MAMGGMSDRGMPPPMKSADRGSPGMAGTQAGAGDMMRRLASREGQGGQGAEQQSAQMLMQGAQMLMQAAQANPALMPIVQQAMNTLKQGVQSLAGGTAGGPPPPPQGAKRSRKPKQPQGGEQGEGAGGEML